MTMTTAEADKILADDFAPWVCELGLCVEALGEHRALLRLSWSQRWPGRTADCRGRR
jgi:hypothetical protein